VFGTQVGADEAQVLVQCPPLLRAALGDGDGMAHTLVQAV
jgi:hypothetical protein